MPHILFVNPWIHDFAAYDFWAKPIGLLYLAAILKQHGYKVSYIDCLDRFHPMAPAKNPSQRYGRGPYLKTKIDKPKGFFDVPRNFCRYGIKRKWFINDILSIPTPDIVFVSSFMTYWYPGIRETIAIIKEVYIDVPIILGGIYATLCYEHAVANSYANRVIEGKGEKHILKLVQDYTGHKTRCLLEYNNLDSYPFPAFELQNRINYIPIITSRGCPFSCTYCASNYLNPKIMTRNSGSVVDEISFWHKKYKIIDFVFYDDAFLFNSEKHAVPILEKIVQTGYKLRFHTPNALHLCKISQKIAVLMFKAGFVSINLGLETIDDLDKKVDEKEFNNAVIYLKKAGFSKNQICAYLLVGLPYQTIASIEHCIKTVKKSGITPILAYYTPIPHTLMWKKAVESSRYSLEADPIFTNNAVFPCTAEPFSNKKIAYLKDLIRQS